MASEDEKVRFPQGMTNASTIKGGDKFLMADADTGITKTANFDTAKQYLSITGQRMKSVPAGALPAGPSDKEMYMVLESSGTWTFGGNTFVNYEGQILTLWWNKVTYSVSSVAILPDSSAKAKPWVIGTYNKYDMVTHLPNNTLYRANKNTILEPLEESPDWDIIGSNGNISFLGNEINFTNPTPLSINSAGIIATNNPTKRGWQNIVVKAGDRVTYFYKLDTVGADGIWLKSNDDSVFVRMADKSPVVRGTNYGSFIADKNYLLNIASNINIPQLKIESGYAKNALFIDPIKDQTDNFSLQEIPLVFDTVGGLSDDGITTSTGNRVSQPIPVTKGDVYIFSDSNRENNTIKSIIVTDPIATGRENVIQKYFANPLDSTSSNMTTDLTRSMKPFRIDTNGFLLMSTPYGGVFQTPMKLYKVTNLAESLAVFETKIENVESIPLVQTGQPVIRVQSNPTNGNLTFNHIGSITQMSSIVYTPFTVVAKGELINLEAISSSPSLIYIRKKGEQDYKVITPSNVFAGIANETINGVTYILNRYRYNDVIIPYDGSIVISNKIGAEITTGGTTTVQKFIAGTFSASIKRRKDNQLKTTKESVVVLSNRPNFMRLDLYGVVVNAIDMVVNNYAVLRDSNRIICAGYMDTKVQGRGSATFPKRGYTLEIKNLNDKEIAIKFGYMPQTDSFHLKAFWSDATQARDVGSGRLWHKMAMQRPYPDNMIHNKTTIMQSTISNDEAFDSDCLFFTDGIPVEVYFDDSFHGLYTVRLKKHRSNYGMDSNNLNHIFLDASSPNLTAYMHEPFDYVDWELRQPKLSGYNGENQPIPEGQTLDAINRFFTWGTGVFNNTINARTTHQDYIILNSWLDYAIWGEVIFHVDSYGNNINLVTWDGLKWSLCPYDTDSTIGIRNTGQIVNETDSGLTMNKGLLGKLMTVFDIELKARYKFLRDKGIVSNTSFYEIYRNSIMSNIPKKTYADNYSKWGGFQNYKLTDRQIMKYLNFRLNYLDGIWLV